MHEPARMPCTNAAPTQRRHSSRTVPAQFPHSSRCENTQFPHSPVIRRRLSPLTLPLITGECGNCVFSQRELCGNCAGTVRELCGNCARAWNAVLSVQAGPSEACSLPFLAISRRHHAYVGSECSQVGPRGSRRAEKVAGFVCATWFGCLR